MRDCDLGKNPETARRDLPLVAILICPETKFVETPNKKFRVMSPPELKSISEKHTNYEICLFP
jgi:hypothetical protein